MAHPPSLPFPLPSLPFSKDPSRVGFGNLLFLANRTVMAAATRMHASVGARTTRRSEIEIRVTATGMLRRNIVSLCALQHIVSVNPFRRDVTKLRAMSFPGWLPRTGSARHTQD
jgi:hypothetical protein